MNEKGKIPVDIGQEKVRPGNKKNPVLRLLRADQSYNLVKDGCPSCGCKRIYEIIKSSKRPRHNNIGCNEILNRELNQLVKLSNIIRRNRSKVQSNESTALPDIKKGSDN